jgi:hypothetical protein
LGGSAPQLAPRHTPAAQPARDAAAAHRGHHADSGTLRIAMLCAASFGTTVLVGLALTSAVHWARRARYRKLATARHADEALEPVPRDTP